MNKYTHPVGIALREIQAVLKKYNLAGFAAVTDSKEHHSIMDLQPTWSVLQRKPDGKLESIPYPEVEGERKKEFQSTMAMTLMLTLELKKLDKDMGEVVFKDCKLREGFGSFDFMHRDIGDAN